MSIQSTLPSSSMTPKVVLGVFVDIRQVRGAGEDICGRGGGGSGRARRRQPSAAPPREREREEREGERATAAHFLIQERNPQRCPSERLQHRQRRDGLRARVSRVPGLLLQKPVRRAGLTFSVWPLMPTRVPRREYSSEDAGRATESSEYGAPSTSKRTSAPAGQQTGLSLLIHSLTQAGRQALTCRERSGATQLGDCLRLLGQVDGALDGRRRRGGLDVQTPAEGGTRRPTDDAGRCGEQRIGSASGHADVP